MLNNEVTLIAATLSTIGNYVHVIIFSKCIRKRVIIMEIWHFKIYWIMLNSPSWNYIYWVLKRIPSVIITSDTESSIILWDCQEKSFLSMKKKGFHTSSAINYEIPQLIKINLDKIFPNFTLEVHVDVKELSHCEFEQNDWEAKEYASRYNHHRIRYEENEDTTEDEQEQAATHKRNILSAAFEESVTSPFLSPINKKRVNWDEAILLYLATENGEMHLVELNTLINHLQISKWEDVTKKPNYDPKKKVIKTK